MSCMKSNEMIKKSMSSAWLQNRMIEKEEVSSRCQSDSCLSFNKFSTMSRRFNARVKKCNVELLPLITYKNDSFFSAPQQRVEMQRNKSKIQILYQWIRQIYFCFLSKLLFIKKVLLTCIYVPISLVSMILICSVSFFIIACIVLVLSFVLCCLFFLIIKSILVPPSPVFYAMKFQPTPSALLLTKPYVNFELAPEFNLYESSLLKSIQCNIKPLAVEDNFYYNAFSSNTTTRACNEIKDKKNENIFHEHEKHFLNYSSYYQLINTNKFIPHIAIGFSSFLNETWDRVDKQGASLVERCMYFHRAKHFGYGRDADKIMKSDWNELFFKEKGSLIQVNGNTVTVSLKLRFDTLSYNFFRLKSSESVKKELDIMYRSLKNDHRKKILMEADFNRLSLKWNVELFDLNCSVMAKNSNVYVLQNQHWFQRFIDFILKQSSLSSNYMSLKKTEIELVLFSNLGTNIQRKFCISRIQISPSLPGLSGELVFTPDIEETTLASRFVNKYPITFFILTFNMCLVSVSVVFFFLFLCFYFGVVQQKPET